MVIPNCKHGHALYSLADAHLGELWVHGALKEKHRPDACLVVPGLDEDLGAMGPWNDGAPVGPVVHLAPVLGVELPKVQGELLVGRQVVHPLTLARQGIVPERQERLQALAEVALGGRLRVIESLCRGAKCTGRRASAWQQLGSSKAANGQQVGSKAAARQAGTCRLTCGCHQGNIKLPAGATCCPERWMPSRPHATAQNSHLLSQVRVP